MKDFRLIVLFAVGFAVLPWFTHSGVLLNALMMALFACLMSQSWNILGGRSHCLRKYRMNVFATESFKSFFF